MAKENCSTKNRLSSWPTHHFSPWKIEGDRRIILPTVEWETPIRWNDEAEAKSTCPYCGYWDNQISVDLGIPTFVCMRCQSESPRSEWKINRLLVATSACDVFEDWYGSISDVSGYNLHWPKNCTIGVWDQNKQSPGFECSDTPVTIEHARNRFFKVIDATPYIDWILLTKFPENIRRMWPIDETDGYGAFRGIRTTEGTYLSRVRRNNVWIGCSYENQQQSNVLPHHLFACSDLTAGIFLFRELD